MVYDSKSRLMLARERHNDLVGEAERYKLAAAARGERPSLRDRFTALFGRREASRQAAQRVAHAAK
jgi:hypothetical protein